MDGELIEPRQPQPEIITPETFFPTEPLNYAFRLFLWHYCRCVDEVKVVLTRSRPQLEVYVRGKEGRRLVIVTLTDTMPGVLVRVSTDIGETNCAGMMQMILLFMNNLDYPSYRLELKNDLTACFYLEVPTFSLRTSGDFYDLIVRLAETASRLEQLEY